MHLVELIAGAATDARAARCARGVPDDDARQGRHPREGHAELHRQPHRRVLDAGDDAAHAGVRAWLRRRRRADRARDRPREERDLSHRRRRRPRHDGARHQDDARHAARRPVACAVRDAAGARGARSRKGALGAEDEGRLLPQGRQGHPGARPRGARTTAVADGSVAPEVAETARRSRAGREVREAARVARIRRRSSCGRSSAISSTTARITSQRSPTTRATSTSRSAGASAGSWVRSRRGRPRAGTRSRRGSPRTSPPARRSRTCRCPHGCSGEKVAAAQRRARAGRAPIRAATRRVRAALALPVYRAPAAFPIRCWASGCRPAARRSSKPTRVRDVAPRRRRRHRVVQDQGRTRSATACSTACSARSTRPSANARAS